MLAPRESENRQQQKTLILTFSLAQKRKEKTNIKAWEQKKKEESKTKNVYLFNWPFAGNRRKKKQQLLARLIFVFFSFDQNEKTKNVCLCLLT
tara:strand:- start:293 stop:571 length:279 start_codon:yes stop_codon:yes gene_type:complete